MAAAQPDNYSGYIVQILYGYSKNANTDINGNIYIDTLHSLLSNAINVRLLQPSELYIPDNMLVLLHEYMQKSQDFKTKINFLINHYYMCVDRVIKNILNKMTDDEYDYADNLNNWNINNKNPLESKFYLVHKFYFSPNNLLYGLKTLFDDQTLVDDSPRQLTSAEVKTIIYHIYDYVILLFTICLATNFEKSKVQILKNPPALSQSNHIIISFLNIFLAYFTPLLNEIHTEHPDQYNSIIDHINWIIGLHNGAHSFNGGVYDQHINTTYKENISKKKDVSKNQNNLVGVSNTYDKSYDFLNEYNQNILAAQQANQPINYSEIFNTTNPDIRNVNLTPTPGHEQAKIYMPEISTDAKYQSVLSKKLGLTQPEIERVLRKMDLNMCRQELELSNTKTQFKITGIPFAGKNTYIFNYLWYFDDETRQIIYGDDTTGFSIIQYFVQLYNSFNDDISKYHILTAINKHTDLIFLCNVGSFGFHTNKLDIPQIFESCDKKYGILLGMNPRGNDRKSINSAHRVMLIVDYKDYLADPADPASEKFKKIYYFEPFGNYYPVFDINGRIIPHIQEMVISHELTDILNTTSATEHKFKFQIVLPLVDNQTAAYNSLFNISTTNYLGESAPAYKILDTVINSAFHTSAKKTLDWMAGYCGLLVLFMALLIKLNCILPQSENQLNIDDIFLWFNHFNSDPVRTYDNLLPRFILRGFAKVVEDILSNKLSQINTVLFDLDKLEEQFRTTIENKQILPELQTQKQYTQSKALKILGLQPYPSGTPENDITKKMNALAFFMFFVANGGTMDEYEIRSDDNSLIEYDQPLYNKLERIFWKKKKLFDEKKPMTNISSGTKLKIFTTAIGNKLRTQKAIKYKAENREKLFKVIVDPTAPGTKAYHFNPDFGKIIFMVSNRHAAPAAAMP